MVDCKYFADAITVAMKNIVSETFRTLQSLILKNSNLRTLTIW